MGCKMKDSSGFKSLNDILEENTSLRHKITCKDVNNSNHIQNDISISDALISYRKIKSKYN